MRDGTRLSGGRACLFVLEQIGWHPLLARLGCQRPLIWGVETGYRLVAGHRDIAARLLFPGENEAAARSGGTDSKPAERQ